MADIWIFLFSFGIVLFGWPIISMFGNSLGIYLFSAWFIFIGMIFLATRYREKRNNGG